VTITPLRADHGESLGTVGIIRDMTRQKALWDTLRLERDKARRYLRIARVTILRLDARGKITLVNRRGCEILGYREEELIGLDYFDTCVPEEVREQTRSFFFERALAGAEEGDSGLEAKVLTRDGAERIIAWEYVRLMGKDGEVRGLLCSGEDITDRKRAQAELIRSEKLAAIGQLAAGVAHEVNNPLAGILIYVDLLLKKHDAGRLQTEETRKQLEKIRTELERSSRIIKDLLDFSRQSKPTLRPIQVNEVLEAALAIVGHQISLGNVTLEKDLGGDVPVVVADFDQIQQALMNVILNAVQAMPEGGVLTIRTRRDEHVDFGGEIRGGARIDITDTGVGIAEENLEKIFTPFFSTKVKGKGVGLGLPAVQGIIERHKGVLKVTSEVGAGTTISTWLEAMDG
jgi:PAS domain S-box-containing protein